MHSIAHLNSIRLQDPRENEEAVQSDVEDEPSRVAGSEVEDGEGEDLMDNLEA